MAKSILPDPLERRVLIERELDPAQALRLAEAYLAEERCAESIAFLRKAGARDRLLALRAQAIESGDLFLLRETSTALGEAPGAGEWGSLAAAAEREGKLRYAAEARRQIERGEG